jgi:hypothetical protein
MEDNQAHVAGLSDAAEWVLAVIALLFLAAHMMLKESTSWKGCRLIFGIALMVAPITVIWLASGRPLVRFSTIVTCVLAYAVSLFVVLSEALTLFGGAAILRRWRGEKWVKELDYVYFAFGSVGAILAVNRLNTIGEKLWLSDLYVPIVLASALVVRVIKTRAEINDWHKC